ncbi:MAG: T9SS type A sorting domain-containing protein [FCB group bacterium]|nr:T9SS type A sorting domain-containing protein [FCB group bacterium]
MISPAIDLSTATAPLLKFYWWDDGSSYTPAQLIVATTTDGATYTPIDTIDTYGSGSTWVLASYSLGLDVTGFKLTGVSDWGVKNTFVDLLTVEEAPTDPILTVSADSLGFGAVIPGMSVDQVLTVSNTGGATLNISSITSTNTAFTVDVTSATVLQDSSLDVTVTFTSSAPARTDFTGDLIIVSDAASSPDTVLLGGDAAPTSGGPDAYGYTWTTSYDASGPTYAWVDTTGSLNRVVDGDDVRGEISLPFPFYFYGNWYTNLWLTTNGWASFGDDPGSSYYSNYTIPSSSGPENMFAPFWDDLKINQSPYGTNYGGGSIRTKVVGTEPNRQFVIIWQDAGRYSPYDNNGTFQAILYETSNNIVFQYLDVDFNNYDNGVSATVGIENIDGTVGSLIEYNGDPQLVYDGEAILFTAPTPPDPLFFSEYIEGSSNNKALEIYNSSTDTVDLSNYIIRGNYNGNAWSEAFPFPNGAAIAPGDVYVIANSSADQAILDVADTSYAYGSPYYITAFNGDDVRALCSVVGTDTTIIDIIGAYDLVDPGSGWDVAGVTAATKDHTLVRKASVLHGNTDWASSAGTDSTNSEWHVLPQNTFQFLGSHPNTIVQGAGCDNPIPAIAGENSTAGAPVWYEYTATVDGSITISSCYTGQLVDTRLSVYDACDGNQVAYNDDIYCSEYSYASEVTFSSQAGVTYKIYWDDYWSADSFLFTLSETSAMVDFVVSSMWDDADTVFAVVTNQGDADSPGWLGFGTDYHGWDVDGDTLRYAAGPALAAGASDTFALYGFTWDNVGIGTYHVGFIADIDNDTQESDETNNSAYHDIVVPAPPIIPQNLQAFSGFGYVDLFWNPAPVIDTSVVRGAETLLQQKVFVQDPITTIANRSGLKRKTIAKDQNPDVGESHVSKAEYLGNARLLGDDCSDPYIIDALPFDTTGSTSGFADDFGSFNSAGDVVFQFITTELSHVTISTDGSGFDTQLFLYDDCAGDYLYFDDDGGAGLQSMIVANNLPAGTYYIVVDGYGSSEGDYVLSVTATTGPLPMADLEITSMTQSADTVTAVVTNIGTADAESFWGDGGTVAWFLDDQYIGEVYPDVFAPGDSQEFLLYGLEYANIGPGTFSVAVYANFYMEFEESDYTNNSDSLDVVILEPDYIPLYNVYRDSILLVDSLPPIDFAFNGGYHDTSGVLDQEYCYYVTQILADSTESDGSNEACATAITPPFGHPPGNVVAEPGDAVVDLYWNEPMSPWEIFWDDGTAEAWYWVGAPDADGLYYFGETYMWPEDNTVDQIKVLLRSFNVTPQDINFYVFGDDNGEPDETNILGGPYTVSFNPVDDQPVWVSVDAGVSITGNVPFHIVTEWTTANDYAVGSDDAMPDGMSYWTMDGGVEWNQWLNHDWMIHAVMGAPVRSDVTPGNYTIEPSSIPYGDAIVGATSMDKNMTEPPTQRLEKITLGTLVKGRNYHVAPVQNSNRAFIGYNVYRSEDGGDNFAQVATGVTDLFYSDLTVVNGTTYWYAVTSQYDEGESLFSNLAVATPLAPGILPYATDFEADNGLFAGDGDWEWGAPTAFDGPDSAHSGSNVWGTVLADDYPNNSVSWLLKPFDLSGVTGTAVMGGWAWYDIESGWDYCYIVAGPDTAGFYWILDQFTGSSDGWETGETLIPDELLSDYTYLGFVFISDGSVTYPGMFLDDLWVEDRDLPELTLDGVPFEGLSVNLLYGDVAGSVDFGLGNAGTDSLDYNITYEAAAGRIINAREIDGAHMWSMDPPPSAGETVDLTLYVTNESSDAEWIDSVVVTFPVGVTVNSSTDMTVVGGTRYLQGDGATGDGASITWTNWDGGFGNIYSTETASAVVNVTIDANYTDMVYFDYALSGDDWGDEPHDITGTFIFLPPLFEVSITPDSGFVAPEDTTTIVGDVAVNEYFAGFYPGFLTIEHNDPHLQGQDVVIPFNVILDPGRGDLTGSVTSSYDGSAVEGATVAVDTFMTTTDATGNFTILDIPEGEWDVMFHAPGFYDYLDSAVVIVVDSTTTLDIAMDPKMPEVVIDAPAEGETVYGSSVVIDFTVNNFKVGGGATRSQEEHTELERPAAIDVNSKGPRTDTPEGLIRVEAAPRELIMLSQHDGVPNNGYYQDWGTGYGVVYDLTDYPGASIELVDFRHSSWGLSGTWDYAIHVVDMETRTPLAVFTGFQTTVDDEWELNIPLGVGTDGQVYIGIFMEPMGNVVDDAYPDIDWDVALDGDSRLVDLADYSDIGASGGDFLMNLWIDPDGGGVDGHIQYFLDGNFIADHFSRDPITLEDVTMGDHNVKLQLVDTLGNVLDPDAWDEVNFIRGNHAPGDFTLAFQGSNNGNINITPDNLTTQILFMWTQSVDMDADAVNYGFYFISGQDSIRMLTTDQMSANISNQAIYDSVSAHGWDGVSTASWAIEASDGYASTWAGDPFSIAGLTIDYSAMGVDDDAFIPDEFALYQNYPNPFNPITTIVYDLPEASNVTIEIYNIVGQRVRTLVSDHQEPGRYKIHWNSTNDLGAPLSSGMYIYRIQAKDFSAVKKLILMK